MEHHVYLNGIYIFVLIFHFANTKACSSQELYNTVNCTSDQHNKYNLMKPSSEWETTIHHCVNTSNKYIQICFTPAPTYFMFQLYEVALLRITDNEGLPTELQERVDIAQINKTNYIFHNLTPGRYRISVSPLDNGSTCKNKFNIPVTCMKTLTGIIELKGEPGDPQYDTVSTTYKSTLIKEDKEEVLRTVAWSQEKELKTHNKRLPFLDFSSSIGFTQYNNKAEDYVDPSPTTVNHEPEQTAGIKIIAIAITFGTLSFALVVTATTVCYKQRKKNNRSFDKTVTEKTVAIISAEDDKIHENVVSIFATCLQKYCRCKVYYYPWTVDKDMFNWISNTIDKADFNMFVISEQALNQYNDWKLKRPTSYGGVFIPYLSRVLNRFANSPFYSQKLIFVTFEHSRKVKMPRELCTSQFHLMDDWKKLLCHIHGFKNDLEIGNSSFNMNLKSRKEGCLFKNATKAAIKKTTHARSVSYIEGLDENKLTVEQNEVAQNYTINGICREPQALDECLIGDISFGVSSRYSTDDLSLCTAVTIAEGEAGGNGNYSATFEHQPQHIKLHSVNKYGECIEPNISPALRRDLLSMDSDNKGNFQQIEIDHDIRSADLISQHIGCFENFIPPEPSLYDDDINSQYQLELMQSINENYLKRVENESTTGYTV